MPKYVIPRLSGVHRVACFALFRALLRQASRNLLNLGEQKILRSLIGSRFNTNAGLQSPPQIISALNIGYASLSTLRAASVGSPQTFHSLSELLTEISTSKIPTYLGKPTPCEVRPKSRKPKLQGNGQIFPRGPDALGVLSRPFPTLSGRRHIPKLVSASGIPFLRFKKPQSPVLSRIIRYKIEQKQRRHNRLQVLKDDIVQARLEDEWDHELEKYYRIQKENPTWSLALYEEQAYLSKQLYDTQQRNKEMAQKMFEVIEKEKGALAREKQAKYVGSMGA